MRGKQAPKRKIENDAKFNNPVVTKLINYIMYGGSARQPKSGVRCFAFAEKLKKPAEIF